MTGCWPCRWNVERFFGVEIENLILWGGPLALL
jgi:hypothetical protein